jgi:hypothetical protein
MGDSSTQPASWNFYAVAIGRQCGIYTNWLVAQEQVNGYSGNSYKGYDTMTECVTYLMDKNSFPTQDDIIVYRNREALTVHEYDTMSSGSGTNTRNNKSRTTLDDLLKDVHGDTVALFCNSLDDLFQYGLKDIEETLLKLDKDILQDIHRDLVQRIGTMFPSYKDKRPRKRQVKSTMITDINMMGYSLVHKSLANDLDKSFMDSGSLPTEQTEPHGKSINPREIAELVKTVHTLQMQVVAIEIELAALRHENKEIRAMTDNKPHNDTISTGVANTVPADTRETPGTSTNQIQNPDIKVDLQSSNNSDSDTSDVSVFQLPAKHRKKLHKLQKRASRQSNVTDNVSVPNITNQLRAVTAQPKDTTPQCDTTRPLLKAAPRSGSRTVDVYIGRVDQNSSREAVSAHLTSMGIQHHLDQVVSLTRNIQAKWLSYKITISREHEDIILRQDNWPSGIIVRPFRVPQTSPQNHRHSQQRQHGHPKQRPTPARRRNSNWNSNYHEADQHFNADKRHDQYQRNEYYWDQPHADNYGHQQESHYYNKYSSPAHYHTRDWDSYDRDYPVLNR